MRSPASTPTGSRRRSAAASPSTSALPPSTGEYRFGIVDVPGHERFVKNMLAGAGGIDLALLVVAADDPSCRRRASISTSPLLRSKPAVVLTKSRHPTERDIIRISTGNGGPGVARGPFLSRTRPLLPRQLRHTGEGIAGTRRRSWPPGARGRAARRVADFRLPVDRCFTMKGFGTVVSGTLIAGRIRKDDEVEVLPVQRGARVRGIQVHGRSVDEARAGQRTALNLQRVELDEIERGMVLVPPDVFKPSRRSTSRSSSCPRHRPPSSAASGCGSMSAPRKSWATSCCSGGTCSSPARRLRPDPSRAGDVRAAWRPLHRPAVLADDDDWRRRDHRRQARPPPPRGRHGGRRAAGVPVGALNASARHARGRRWHPRHRRGGTVGPAGRDTEPESARR